LIDLVTGVARRMRGHVRDVKLVVADLSSKGGGGGPMSSQFHRSHQSGRDADLLPYMRDADGKAFEPDAMHVFDGKGHAKDGSGITIDVPRTWQLVKELLNAPEAPVQYIFMYEPLCLMLLEHGKQAGESEAFLAKARKALRQPGDSARHDDHMHVRVYCAEDDRAYGCVDMGPMDLLAERQAEQRARLTELAQALPTPPAAPPVDNSMRAQLEAKRDWGSELWTGEAATTLQPIGARLRRIR
jgi:penicillin-insensitive murein endopeptidase